MVPGSTLMYGSSLSIVTLRPRDSRMAASEAAAMPFPREETTPPVMKMYLVMRVPGQMFFVGRDDTVKHLALKICQPGNRTPCAVAAAVADDRSGTQAGHS